jgi:cytidylate kinase
MHAESPLRALNPAKMVITISPQYGSAAMLIAHDLKERLRYRLVDDDLPSVVALELGITREAAERVGSAPKTLSERLLRGFLNATPEAGASAGTPDIDAEYVRAIEQAVRNAAAEGDCIILGRAAGTILADCADVLRVFLHGPLPWRVHRIMEHLRCDEKTASAEIARVDDARVKYAREYYKIDRNDTRLYHLAIDVSRFGVTGTTDLIVAALHTASAVR